MLDFSLFLSEFDPLTETELQEASAFFQVKEIEQKAPILSEGEICKKVVFVLAGSFRQYTLVNGEEVNFLFYFEREFALDFNSFLTLCPSRYSICALEPSIVLELELATLNQLKQRSFRWELFMKQLTENALIRLYKRNEVLLTHTPEERYLKLLEVHPFLCHKVPLNKIATFIGITVQSLSRIRSRLAAKGI